MLARSADTDTDDTHLPTVAAIVARIAERHGISHAIAANDSLVDRGMTSMAMVDLMLAVEAEFDVTIPQREMTPANFRSITCLAQLLARL
jgi:acyl carrier protein